MDFRPGFRVSEVDIAVLIAGVLGSALLIRFDESLAIAVFFTLGHFFLFCNVLRMSRPLELAWAVTFVFLAGSTFRIGFPPFIYTLLTMLVITTILAAIQILRPSYHGAFWQQLNPNLPQWWAAQRKNEA